MRLICLSGITGPQEYGAAWRAGLAPQIEVVSVQLAMPSATFSEIGALIDDKPYAVFGRGPWALAALEISRVLSRVRAPAQLQVASCPAPNDLTQGISWPITAFAAPGTGLDKADGMVMWRSVTTGPFTLRLLPEPAANQVDGWADADTLLAVKEELRVWPN
jgi:hypothetical protein